jgi:hypothetical protein
VKRCAPLLVLSLVLAGCGGAKSPTASPSTSARTTIAAAIRSAVPVGAGIHLDILRVRLSRDDPHFASAAIEPKDARGRPTTDTGIVVLMESGGAWTVVIGPGTAFPEECKEPAPKAILQLMCPDPYTVLGVG